MAKRSSVLVILGIALFVLGVAIVYLVVRDDDETAPVAEGSSRATVLVADEGIPAGASGSDVLAGGKAKVQEVDAREVAPGALTSAAALTGRVFSVEVPDGVQIREADLKPLTLRGNLAIPDGKQAMAIQVPFVPGVAGYVGAGDLVNIYAVVSKGPQAPLSKLLLSNITVLDVSLEVAPRRSTATQSQSTTSDGSTDGSSQQTATGTRSDAGSITYLLAVDAVQAERLVFTVSNESVYLTLVPPNQEAAATGGESYQGVLR